MIKSLIFIYVLLRLRVQNRRKNGISRSISRLCVNCLISIPEYSRITDYSIIWMCIWCGLLQKLYKIKKSELLHFRIYYLKDTSQTILKYSRKFQNGEYSRIGMCIWNGLLQNLNMKSEKSKILTFSLEFNGQVLVRQD